MHGQANAPRPSFQKSPLALVERFEEGTAWLLDEPGVQRRKMFGYPACFVGGNMFTSLYEHRWTVRLSDADRAELAVLGGTEFEVMPGRPMRGYLALPEELTTPNAARPWLERSLAFGRSLPPKKGR
jgi:TfoX/Sxy family transcriptional regulator of competence genes